MSNDTLDQQLKHDGPLDTKSNAIKFGVIGGLGGIIISLILFFANLQYESWSKWLQSLVMIVAIVVGVKAIAAANKHKVVSFGALFGAGMLITTIIAIISIVYFFLYSNFIETNFIDNLLDVSRAQMAEKGLSEEQVDAAIEMSKKFMSPGIMMAISLFSSLIMGAIVSLISAAIFKNEK